MMGVRIALLFLLMLFSLGSGSARAESGDIFVSADVEGAPIWLDDRNTGERTPYVLKGVEVGPHRVRVQTPCGSAETDVDVRPGRISRVELLSPQGVGTLRVLPDPSSAQIRIDGRAQSPGQSQVTLACGEHQIEVRAPGHQALVRTVQVAVDSHRELAVTLQAIVPGTLVVDVYPLNATIYLDGSEVAQGPVTLEPVSAGDHVLMASADGYADYTRVIRVSGEEVTRVEVELQLADMVATPRASAERSLEPVTELPRSLRPEDTVEAPSVGGVPERTGATTSSPRRSGLGVGIGLTVLGLGAGAYAAAQYPVAIDIYDQYLDAETDDEADELRDQLLPVQRRMVGAGVLGGVSLISGGIVWVRASETSQIRIGLGPRTLEMSGTW